MNRTLLLVVPQLDPVLGMERATLDLLRCTPEGWSVRVLALSGGPPAGGVDVPVTYLGLAPGWRRAARARRPVQRVSDLLRPDVVVASGLWSALPVLSGRHAAPVVVWEHSLLPQRVAAERPLALMARAARWTYPRARAVVTVSESVAAYVRRRVPRLPEAAVRVIWNPVAPGDQALRPPADGTLRLLSVGSLIPRKNHALSIRALAYLPDTATLDICGDGPERGRLLALAAELGVSDRVHLHGYVQDPFLAFPRSRVYVHPSRAETFGLAVFEAAQHGLPSVVLDAPALHDFVPGFAPGETVSQEDAQQVAEAILRVRDIPEAEFEATARRRERLLGPVAIGRAWGELLEEVAR